MEAVGVGLFFAAWLTFVFGGMALWIWALVDVAKLPEHAFRMVQREKVSWILIVALAQIIGAIIWFLGPRKQVRAAYAANPYAMPAYLAGPPPGWYPDPSGAPGQAWWDGAQWTGHHQS